MKRTIACLLLMLAILLPGCNKTVNCTVHLDEDHDLSCDRCKGSVLVLVDFYVINDLHGKLADSDNHPGVDELTTYLKAMQANDDHAVFLSSGDMWQGSSESNLTDGKIITDWMNALDFAAMTLGNHEFDWGEEAILTNADLAEFPLLAINIYDRETDTRVSYCQPSTIVDLGVIQIGIIGAIGDCYSSISADKVEDVYFKTGSELTDLVKTESQRLRESGVELVIYSLHDGFGGSNSGMISDGKLSSYYDISLSDGYVDLVFEGHTHQKYTLQDSYGVYHLQGGGDNKGITHAELAYNLVTGQYSVTDSKLVSTTIYEDLPDDPIVAELLNKYAEEISKANEVLGYNTSKRNRDWLRQTAADLYLQAGLEKWGAEYDITLAGGFFSVRSPGYLDSGEVTYGMLQSLFPFDNELVLCSISGRDLLDRFLNTSNDNYFIARADSRKIDPDGIYYIVVDSYTSTYAPNRLTEIVRYGADVYARDLLADYIAAGNLE